MWPSLTASLPAFARGKGMLTIGGGKNTMTGPSEFKSQQLKACMAHNIAADPRRSATLHHVKMAAGIVRPLQRGGPQREVAPLCAWVYAGSHNLSGAAWGKMEAATGSDDESGDEDEEFVVMSYEVGVLLLPPEPRPFALPWVTAAAPYDPTEVKPFSTSRYLAILRGRDSRAWDSRDNRMTVDEVTGEVRRQWERLRDGAGGAGLGRGEAAGSTGAVVALPEAATLPPPLGGLLLPTLLTIPLDEVRKLVLLKVEAEARPYPSAPEPGSAARRRARHLKRGGTASTDELLKASGSSMRSEPLPLGAEVRALRLGDFSYGEGDAKAIGDPIVTVYQTVGYKAAGADAFGGCSHDPYLVDYDLMSGGDSEERRPAVRVVDRRGPAGVLLAFFADSDGGATNTPLLQTLALVRSHVEAACWGVFCLQPDEAAGALAPVRGRAPPSTPSHADLLALEFGVAPASELPALVLVTADLQTRLLFCRGGAALAALVREGAGPLVEKLSGLASEQRTHGGGAPTSWWRRAQERRSTRAAHAAAWVRARGCKLVLVEPEGVLKKQCNVSVVRSAGEAVAKRRASLWGAARNDAFYAACVPFLRALLLELPVSADGELQDPYDPLSQYGDGPPQRGVLRTDAPRIALVSSIGHLVSKRRPGEAELLPVQKVREVVAALVARLASELRAGAEAALEAVSRDASVPRPTGERAPRGGGGAARAARRAHLLPRARQRGASWRRRRATRGQRRGGVERALVQAAAGHAARCGGAGGRGGGGRPPRGVRFCRPRGGESRRHRLHRPAAPARRRDFRRRVHPPAWASPTNAQLDAHRRRGL